MEVAVNGEKKPPVDDDLQCKKCNYSAISKRQLQRHNKQKHSPSKHTCEECGEKFARALLFKLHMAKHNTKLKTEHICYTCNKSFPLLSLLKIHQEAHVSESIHPCPHCSKQFRQRSALSKHVAFGHNKRNINACSACSQVFPSHASLMLHMDTHKANGESEEKKEEKIQSSPSSPRTANMLNLRTCSPYRRHIEHNMFKCQRCQKKFFTSTALARHMRVHANIQTHICTECKEEFTSKKALQKHSASHVYECDTCNRKYKQRTQLEHHVKHDCKAKALVCKICNRAFNKNSALQKHMETHGDGNRFQCPECCKNYKTQADLLTHQWLHQGDGFKCDECSKTFGTKQHLIWHSYLHITKFPNSSDNEVKKETDNSESNIEKEDASEIDTALTSQIKTPNKIKKETADGSETEPSKEAKPKSSKTPAKEKDKTTLANKCIKLEPKTPIKKIANKQTPNKTPKSDKKKTLTKDSENKKIVNSAKKDKKQHDKSDSEVKLSSESRRKRKQNSSPKKCTENNLLNKSKSRKKLKLNSNTSDKSETSSKELPTDKEDVSKSDDMPQTINDVEELIARGVEGSPVKRESIDVKDIPAAEVMFDDLDENVELDIREAIATLTELGAHNEIGPVDELMDTLASVDAANNSANEDSAIPQETDPSCDAMSVVEHALQTESLGKDSGNDLEALYSMDTDNENEAERNTALANDPSAELLSELTERCMSETNVDNHDNTQTQSTIETQTDIDGFTDNMNLSSGDLTAELVSHINLEVADVLSQSTKEIENLCRSEGEPDSRSTQEPEIVPEDAPRETDQIPEENASENQSIDYVEDMSNINQLKELEKEIELDSKESSVTKEPDTEMIFEQELTKDEEVAKEEHTEKETNRNKSDSSEKTEESIMKSKEIVDENSAVDEGIKEKEQKTDSKINEGEIQNKQVPPNSEKDESVDAVSVKVNNQDSIAEENDTPQNKCDGCSTDFENGIKRDKCPHSKKLKVIVEKLDCKDCPSVDSPVSNTKTADQTQAPPSPVKPAAPIPVKRTRRSTSSELKTTTPVSTRAKQTEEKVLSGKQSIPTRSSVGPARSSVGSARLRRRVTQTSGTRSVSTKPCSTRRRLSQNSSSDSGSKSFESPRMTRSANQRSARFTRSGAPLHNSRESRRSQASLEKRPLRKVTSPPRKKVETEKSPPPIYKVSTVTDLTIRITTQESPNSQQQQAKKSLSPREEYSSTSKSNQKPIYTVSTSPSQDPTQISKLYISKSPPERYGHSDFKNSRNENDERQRRNAGATQEICVVLDDINELVLLQQERLQKLKHFKPVKLSRETESVNIISKKKKTRSEDGFEHKNLVPQPAKLYLKLPKDRIRQHEQRLALLSKQAYEFHDDEDLAPLSKDFRSSKNLNATEDASEYQQPDSSQDMHRTKNVIRVPKISPRRVTDAQGPRSKGKTKSSNKSNNEETNFDNVNPSGDKPTTCRHPQRHHGRLGNAGQTVLCVEECDSTSMAETHSNATKNKFSNLTNKKGRVSKERTESHSAAVNETHEDAKYEPLDLSIRMNQLKQNDVKRDPDNDTESTDIDTQDEFCSCTDDKSSAPEDNSHNYVSLQQVSVKAEPTAVSSIDRNSGHDAENCSTEEDLGSVKGDTASGGTGVQTEPLENEQITENGESITDDDVAGASAEFIEVIDRATQCELGDEVLFNPELGENNLD